MGKLTIGDSLPAFKLKDQNDAWFSSDQLNGKPAVIYFYPKDDTPGCTKEACSFRDQFEAFSDLGAAVIGISSDSPASHKKFAEKYRLPFTLLSDSNRELRKTFGVPTNLLGLIPGRVTYIFSKEGKLIHIFNSQTNAEQHVDEALKFLSK